MCEQKDRSRQIEFIYKAIDDTANTIRFLDTKVGSVIIIIGIIFTLLGTVKDSIGDIIKNANNCWFLWLFATLSIIYIILTMLSLLDGFRALKPIDNPRRNIKDKDEVIPEKKLWYLPNDEDNKKLSLKLEDYQSQVKELNEDELIKIISFELLKLSYIRNIKLKRADSSIIFLIISIAVLVFLVALMYVSVFL